MAQEIADSTLLDTWGSSGAKIEPDISKIIEGWQLGEQPPHEYMNWIQNTFGSKLNHILKNGIAKWEPEKEFLAGATVQHSGNVWLSKTTNTNSAPTDVNANWERIITVESLTTVLGGYVATTGNQTIAGVKTFSSSPIVPAPTTDFQASTKKYVDDNITPPYNPTPTIATGTATFTATTNNINLTGIGLGVEIGDVIQISGAEDAKNNSEFTVEVITDNNNIIVNQAHAGKGTTKNVADRSGDINVTVKLLAKWYNASEGLGQDWVDVTASRIFETLYSNNTKRNIKLSIATRTDANTGVETQLLINGNSVSRESSRTTYIRLYTHYSTAQIDNTYQLNSASGLSDILQWKERR